MRVTVIATGFELQPEAKKPEQTAQGDDIDKPVGAAAKPTKPEDISDIDEIFSIFKH